ncbi:hypothetical protein LACWKB10_1819 [Lactobacillus sp. wkB10]|nr:hypothetical protein LACWKB10_1819 [Lactobacillus sp. wkB10]
MQLINSEIINTSFYIFYYKTELLFLLVIILVVTNQLFKKVIQIFASYFAN